MPLVNLYYDNIKKSSAKGEKNAENNNRSKRNKQGKTAKEIVKDILAMKTIK
jgi:hypothetical protein